jgi:hypothetical protein
MDYHKSIEIHAAKIRLERLRLQADEERLLGLQAEAKKMLEPLQRAKAKHDEAIKALRHRFEQLPICARSIFKI